MPESRNPFLGISLMLPHHFLHHAHFSGQQLLERIEYQNRNRKLASESDSMSTPQDVLDTIEKVEEMSRKLKERIGKVETTWKTTQKSYEGAKDLGVIEKGVVNVTNWILGPAENLLNAQQGMGYDVASAEELRNTHEVKQTLTYMFEQHFSKF